MSVKSQHSYAKNTTYTSDTNMDARKIFSRWKQSPFTFLHHLTGLQWLLLSSHFHFRMSVFSHLESKLCFIT